MEFLPYQLWKVHPNLHVARSALNNNNDITVNIKYLILRMPHKHSQSDFFLFFLEFMTKGEIKVNENVCASITILTASQEPLGPVH